MPWRLKKAIEKMEEAEALIVEIKQQQRQIDEALQLALPPGQHIPFSQFEQLPYFDWIEFWPGTTGIKIPSPDAQVMRIYCEYDPAKLDVNQVLPHSHDCVERLLVLQGELIDAETGEVVNKEKTIAPYTMHSYRVENYTKALVEFFRP